MRERIMVRFHPTEKKDEKPMKRFNVILIIVNVVLLLINTFLIVTFWNTIPQKESKKAVISIPNNRDTLVDAISAKDTTHRVTVDTIKQPVIEPKKVTESIIHQVESGQSLALISELYGVSIDSIKSKNNLTKNTITIGMKLKIPARNKLGL